MDAGKLEIQYWQSVKNLYSDIDLDSVSVAYIVLKTNIKEMCFNCQGELSMAKQML